MEKKKRSTSLKIAVAAGILFFIAMLIYGQASKGLTPVVVAKKLIPAGETLKKEDLEVIQVLKPPKGAVSKIEAAVGKKISLPRLPGDMILQDSLQGTSQTVPEGQAGLVIPVENKDLLEVVKPNDTISFIATSVSAGQNSFEVGNFKVLMVFKNEDKSSGTVGSLFVAGDPAEIYQAAGYLKNGQYQIVLNPSS
ncbi:SAF domain-containing protein [Carboxydothermus ferrireducens]|uniref:Flp pilus assembly protein CpaB n=1 Tax=Carboxydothermus ferrireducens DSM 11255 TaxID=1119529 RepID=A0ABX2RBH5_9THEO|nr:SAF domain-containing protein [Carboxydothermus ferrireducens]NYE57143.1 Flp pilus assembly protein CpaB [Carboxydothermus ferrireducens DSM 11255]